MKPFEIQDIFQHEILIVLPIRVLGTVNIFDFTFAIQSMFMISLCLYLLPYDVPWRHLMAVPTGRPPVPSKYYHNGGYRS